MKPLNIRNIVLLLSLPFLMAWLVACSPHKYPRAFIVADSLMEVKPDSAVALLNAIGTTMHQHGEKDRMYYELLRLKAADKANQPVPDTHKADSILHYYEQGGDKRLLATAYYYAARTYYEKKDAPQALDYFQKAAEAVGDDYELAGCIYSQMGVLFTNQGLYENAEDAFKAEYEIALKSNDTLVMVYALNDLAYAAEAHDDHALSNERLTNAYHLALLQKNKSLLAELYLSLAVQNTIIRDFAQAHHFADRCLENISLLDSARVYYMMAKLYNREGNDDSLAYYCKMLEHNSQLHMNDSINRFQLGMALRSGNADMARVYFNKFIVVDDSIKRVTQSEATAKVNALYNYQLREKENVKLRQANNHKKMMVVGLGVCVIVVFVSSVSYLYRLRRKHAKETFMLKYAEHLKDKKISESHNLIVTSQNRIAELENELEKEKQKLFSLQQFPDVALDIKKEAEIAVHNSQIYLSFLEMSDENSKIHPTEADWQSLEELLTSIYDRFPLKLKVVCSLSKRDYRMCLLIKAKMSPQRIANIFSIVRSSVASQRARLYKEHFGKKGGAKAWDEFILSL